MCRLREEEEEAKRLKRVSIPLLLPLFLLQFLWCLSLFSKPSYSHLLCHSDARDAYVHTPLPSSSLTTGCPPLLDRIGCHCCWQLGVLHVGEGREGRSLCLFGHNTPSRLPIGAQTVSHGVYLSSKCHFSAISVPFLAPPNFKLPSSLAQQHTSPV